ncbi:cellulose binding domain-containing protein [Micromonospora sp. NPDC005979]|uniref:cellulose binding domain-containing protein n=1 Tax=Micromonospora sp. NPDC005979 TaxID=3156726 RepID=UPI0033B84993
MPATPPQPRRTVAIILLDRIVAAAAAVRRVVTGQADVSRATWVAVFAALGVVVATVVSIVSVVRTPEQLAPVTLDAPPSVDQLGTPGPGTPRGQAQPAATSPTTVGSPSASAARPPVEPPSSAPAVTPSSASPTPAALAADFVIEDNALLSYGAAVTISNPGPVPATGWTLTITLPRESLRVSAVEGARATQDGAVWTFVPDGSVGQVPGSGSTRVTFRVNGAAVGATPTACTIDGIACGGLSN